ncbi:MAG: family 78 glycoside hydrolase catalytic domain, partial [Devosia sp.]
MNEALRLNASTSATAVDRPWTATMIRPLADKGVGTPASFVRKSFDLSAVGGHEQLRISALGLYRCFINGQRVGDDLLTPGWTCYDARLSYQTYDVGKHLKAGTNVIDIWLADGWLRSQMMWKRNPIYNTWGNEIAAIAELSTGPGGDVLLKTDASWQSGTLPILKSGIYFGEIFDARLGELKADQGVAAAKFDSKVLLPHEATPVRELAALPVVDSWKDSKGRWTYDFGQNAAGYVAFTVKGKAGAKLTIEHAEILDGDRNIDNTNYRSAEARVEYILKGDSEESYKPFFTFFGYRYAAIAIDGEATITAIESIPVSSAQTLTAGFVSGNKLVNRLVENTIWSLRSNFIEAPTDCP